VPVEVIPFNPGPGYVAPSSTTKELNDIGLDRFLQQLVAGIAGMPGFFVFPRWQPEPPNQPRFGTDWAAVGKVNSARDTFAYVQHSTNPNNFYDSSDMVDRSEVVEIMASFYGPNADSNGQLFSMGLALPQNRWTMQLNGYGLVSAGDAVVVPALIKQRWVHGIDVHFRLRRRQDYIYPSPNVIACDVTIAAQEGNRTEISIAEVNPKYGPGLGGYGVQPYNTGEN
jgi:hypothetical protein